MVARDKVRPPVDVNDMIETGRDEVSIALDSVIDRFGALMHRIGRAHRLPDVEIDEAIQDVRIRLWRTLAAATNIRRVPATYVYRTTISAILDLIRRRRSRRETAVESLDARVLPIAAPGPAPDARLHTEAVAEEIARAIDELTETRRGVVRMHLAGYGRDEIAQLLGWSEPKTRNLLYRGLAELRERLAMRDLEWTVRDD